MAVNKKKVESTTVKKVKNYGKEYIQNIKNGIILGNYMIVTIFFWNSLYTSSFVDSLLWQPIKIANIVINITDIIAKLNGTNINVA